MGSGFVAVANSSFLKRAPWGIGLGTVLGHLSKLTLLPHSFLFTHPLLISAHPTVLHPSKPRVLLAEMQLLIPCYHLLKCFSPLCT